MRAGTVGVFIGLGSNLGDGPALIREALAQLDSRPGIRVLRVSSLYRTAPWGRTDQPDFTNAVAELETGIGPADLLQELLDCEAALGRTRESGRWGPRRIDLDLLCFDDRCVVGSDLVLPHPRMHERAFVLAPLLDLEPDFVIPGVGAASERLAALGPQQVERID